MKGVVAGLRYSWRSGPLSWLVLIAAASLVMLSVTGMHGAGGGGRHMHPGTGFAGIAAWLLMVSAMMPPLLVLPVRHVSRSTFPRNHASAMACFGAGYLAVWSTAALVLLPLAEAAERTGAWGPAFSLAVAIAWSASPAAQFGRNRCHRLIPINPVGVAWVRDCFTQGLVAALPCALVCWPWMVLPMTVPGAMSLVAGAVTLLIFVDRLEPPSRCRWRVPPWIRMIGLVVRPQKVVGRL